MDSLLITGGAGFIGSNFVRLALQKTSAHIVILDALTYAGNLANLEGVLENDRITFAHCDITDRDALAGTFRDYNIDTVVHFAAESHVDRSILGPGAFIETNVTGTFNLLEAARSSWQEKWEGKNFLHVSTDEVFGSLSANAPPFSETSNYDPSSPYSASKAASDHLVRAWHLTYGMPVLISNCSNNYGPWQFPEKLIPLMILNAAASKDLPVYGDGMQVRDWLHVDDHCEALLAILAAGVAGETYCIGGDNEQPNINIVETICDIVDRRLGRSPGTGQKLIRYVEDRPGHDRRYAIDASKIKDRLGWSPKREFTEALGEVVDWYLNQGDWIDSIRSGEYMKFYEEQYRSRLEKAI